MGHKADLYLLVVAAGGFANGMRRTHLNKLFESATVLTVNLTS